MDNNIIAVITALISVVSYICYAFFYKEAQKDEIGRKDVLEINLAYATILYGGASLILLILIIFSSALYGWEFNIPSDVNLWNTYNSKYLLLIPLLLMSFGYATHIFTEAYVIGKYETPIYTIFFQLYLLVVALLGFWINHDIFSQNKIIGGLIVVSVSIYCVVKSQKITKISRWAAFFAVISAVSCGSALFIDAEIVEKVIEIKHYKNALIAPYLTYEFLTFFIPHLIVFSLLAFRKKSIKSTLVYLFEIIRSNKKIFFIASLFSTFQFVFSVFPLAFAKDRILPITIIATMGLLSDFIIPILYKFYKNEVYKPSIPLKIKLLLSILTFIGVFLVLNN